MSRPLENNCLCKSWHLSNLPFWPSLRAAPDFESEVRREHTEMHTSSHSWSVLCSRAILTIITTVIATTAITNISIITATTTSVKSPPPCSQSLSHTFLMFYNHPCMMVFLTDVPPQGQGQGLICAPLIPCSSRHTESTQSVSVK